MTFLPRRSTAGQFVPETAGGFFAIGYAFGSRLQWALQIPLGIIDNVRGGSAIESWVLRHKFAEHPLVARYLAWVDRRRAGSFLHALCPGDNPPMRR